MNNFERFAEALGFGGVRLLKNSKKDVAIGKAVLALQNEIYGWLYVAGYGGVCLCSAEGIVQYDGCFGLID